MKNYFKLIMLSFAVFLMACGKSSNENKSDEISEKDSLTKTTTVELVKLWQTDTLLITSEAVRYHSETNTIFVSNIGNVPPDNKDGDGTISKIDLEGNIISRKRSL